ncbi:hypothetical protein JEO93_07350 [Proteus mirabilis]|nr:hypothetical protein [Proteus mirabilis]
MDINFFEEIEKTQSHTFINFCQGIPFTILGWEKYRGFNDKMNGILLSIKNNFDIDVYLQEYEDINIDRNFYWIYSFSTEDNNKLLDINSFLKENIDCVMNYYFQKDESGLYSFNNHDSFFKEYMHPELAGYYVHMVVSYDTYIKPIHPPREKSYQKKLFDLSKISDVIKISEFKKIIMDYMSSTDPLEHHEFMFADDGFFSSKYEGNKTLREEFLPIIKFIKYYKIPENLDIQLGTKKYNFDAKIFHDKNSIILELTSALPDHDHFYLSLRKGVSPDGYFPVKNMHDLKKEFDMFPEKIVTAINDKHAKKYKDKRILIVNMPMEYTYQNEDYIINEIVKEVKAKVTQGKGNFIAIILNDKKMIELF